MVPENLLEKNLSELRAMAQALGVKNIGKYRKNELVEMLQKSEAPAPKKRGRPAKNAQQKGEEEPAPAPREAPQEAAQASAPVQDQPKARATKRRNETKSKAPEKAPAAEEKPQPAQEQPAPAPKAEAREEGGEKQELRRRNDRLPNNRYQRGNTRHDRSYNNGERRYQSPNGQDQKAPRPAASNSAAASGEEEKPYYNQEYGTANPAVPKMLETENCPPVEGVLEVLPDGYGFLRMNNYYSGPKDIYLSSTQSRRFSLKTGDYVEGRARPHREGDKFDALMYIDRVNGLMPDRTPGARPSRSWCPSSPMSATPWRRRGTATACPPGSSTLSPPSARASGP